MSPRLEFLEKFLASNFALLDAEDRRSILLVQMEKNDFCELWQQHKILKTMEMSEVWPAGSIQLFKNDLWVFPTKITAKLILNLAHHGY